MMSPWRKNPFPETDASRHAIWEMLVERDIAAFLARDWAMIAGGFLEEGFAGHIGAANPDHWRIGFPSLESYREEWLRQADELGASTLVGEEKANFLFRASVLRDIEISGEVATAHKKFDGRAMTAEGRELVLNWQSIYWLRKTDRWRITGFVGYLPNPMPQTAPAGCRGTIETVEEASQHKTAGPYSPVLKIRTGSLVAISGQGPIDMQGQIVGSTIEEQTELTLQNCRRQLRSAGATLRDVFKSTVYLGNMAEWAAFNEVYARHFHPPYPVRTAIQAVLWNGIKVEIDMLAISH